MIHRRRTAQRGFTLLELLITLGITTIGLIGLLSLHLSIVRANDSTNRSSEATVIGNRTLEELRAMRIADMMTTLTGNPAGVPPVDTTILGTVAGRNGVTYARRVQVTALTADTTLWRVRVEVSWTDDGAAVGATVEGVAGLLDHKLGTEIIRTNQEAL